MTSLTQSYRPDHNDSEWPQPLEKSVVAYPKFDHAERPIRCCFDCESCGRLTLTTVTCNYNDKGDNQ